MAVTDKTVENNGQEIEGEKEKEQVNIAEPMFIWVLLLVIALSIEIIAAHTNFLPLTNQLDSGIVEVANLILFMPGAIILPLIVGAIIGAEVGKRSKSMRIAVRAGLLNGIYACIVYVIAIMVIYEIAVYTLPASVIPSIAFLVSEWIVVPAVIVIFLSLAFAMLSHSRKVNF